MKAAGMAWLLVASMARAQSNATPRVDFLSLTNPPASSATSTSPATSAAGTEPQGRLLGQKFRDYTIVLLAPTAEPWQAFYNDAQQMARYENPTNGAMITSQFIQFPADRALEATAGDRDRYLDLALRKYCAALFSLARDPEMAAQPIETKGRQVGDHYFRYCSMWGRDRNGGRRLGAVYLMLRGRAEKPKFTGEILLLTIGYPELTTATEEKRMMGTFDVLLQNLSFL
jgi:hypothetical protein